MRTRPLNEKSTLRPKVRRLKQALATKTLRPRERILISASHLFAGHGLHGVTIREIAADAEVQLPALYRAFANKKALYLAAANMVFGDAADVYSARLKRPGDAKRRLLQHVVSVYGDLVDDDRLRNLLARETLFGEGANLPLLAKNAFGPQFNLLVDLCRKVGGAKNVERRAFEIYIVAVGYVHMRPLGLAAGVAGFRWDDAPAVARRILGFVFPEIRWARVRK